MGRDIFKEKKKSFADSYDYNIDVIYPSNHARINFERIVPNIPNHKVLTVKTSDLATM